MLKSLKHYSIFRIIGLWSIFFAAFPFLKSLWWIFYSFVSPVTWTSASFYFLYIEICLCSMFQILCYECFLCFTVRLKAILLQLTHLFSSNFNANKIICASIVAIRSLWVLVYLNLGRLANIPSDWTEFNTFNFR